MDFSSFKIKFVQLFYWFCANRSVGRWGQKKTDFSYRRSHVL